MTQNADFKRLIRARMTKTGESYASARDALLRSGEVTGEIRASIISPDFAPGVADSTFVEVRGPAAGIVADLSYLSITVEHGVLRVVLGKDPVFQIEVPLSLIATARPVKGGVGGKLGAHGRRGKWLVNSTSRNLVRLTLASPVRASLNVSAALDTAGAADRVPRLLRSLVRDRRPNVRELTLSVEEPTEFLRAIRATQSA